jgi:hypothetical protein
LETLSDLLDEASSEFKIRRKVLDLILDLERRSLYMETARNSVKKKLREIIQEESQHENKKD